MAEENETTSETPAVQVDQASEADKEESRTESGSQAGDLDRNDTILEEDDGEQEELQEGQELSDDAKALKAELDKIKVEPPPTRLIREQSEIDQSNFTEEYKENSPKEKLVLAYAENFRRQFVHLYRDRKPLLLAPKNECGVEKFVCTTIRPTQLRFKELYNWDGAADFVADYLNFEALDPAHELPTRLLSPTTIIDRNRQKGNCFEYSNLLVSLLIAAGYDAYVVSGYASRETCLMDETREICPLLQKKEEVLETTTKKEQKKYTVKPPKDLRSKFELKQAARKQREQEEAAEKLRLEEVAKQLTSEKPPPDSLHGLRVHSWVLVLEGKREVPESFFIEPLTGQSHDVKSDNYLGIEAVWNHQNYWVNMQDCSEGVKKMIYDLGDCTLWEYIFPSNDKPTLQIPDEDELLDDEDEEENEDVEKHLDMPPSWVMPIQMTQRDFQMRCPGGKKSKLYKRAKLEKFAHYLMKDGLVSRLSVYSDRELIDLLHSKEYFANRRDKLLERKHNQTSGWKTEIFSHGRPRSLKEHQYMASAPGPENERTMVFYDEARDDGLHKRIEAPSSMEEHFINRDDFLFYRSVDFGKRPKKFGPAETQTPRPILKMVEKYRRNPSKPAMDDMAEIIFQVAEERIQVTYHTEDSKISASTREFIKPPNSDEKGAVIQWHPDTHTTFQVDPSSSDKKRVVLYEMLVELLRAEDSCRERIRESEEEVQAILRDRDNEEVSSDLDISVYDTERNEKARKHREDLERLQAEEKKRREDMELDYLAPFLAKLDNPNRISAKDAYTLKEDCLADLKQRLIDKANLIQARFEKETQELQKKQAWYQQNQVSMQKDDEEEYLNYCSEAMFRIHILELRLNRHKELAPQRYMALEQKIRTDPRLGEYF